LADSGGGPRGIGEPISWRFAPFGDLTALELHDILQARSAVFVVEQNCVFLDVDGADPHCWHLLGRKDATSPLLAYCRLVPPGLKFPEPSIGRVVTTAAGRGTGAGRELMAEAVERAHQLWPGAALRIGAQMYLERFYGGYGFVKSSEPYDEDGIMHIEMLRNGRQT
jgi:ElaA protein